MPCNSMQNSIYLTKNVDSSGKVPAPPDSQQVMTSRLNIDFLEEVRTKVIYYLSFGLYHTLPCLSGQRSCPLVHTAK